MAQKQADWPNTELTNLRISIDELIVALDAEAARAGRRGVRKSGVTKEDAENDMRSDLARALQSPLNQHVHSGCVKPKASGPNRRLYTKIQQFLDGKDAELEMQDELKAVVRALDPDHPFLREDNGDGMAIFLFPYSIIAC